MLIITINALFYQVLKRKTTRHWREFFWICWRMRLHLIYCPGFHLVFSHYELIMHDLGSELFHHLTVVDTDVRP